MRQKPFLCWISSIYNHSEITIKVDSQRLSMTKLPNLPKPKTLKTCAIKVAPPSNLPRSIPPFSISRTLPTPNWLGSMLCLQSCAKWHFGMTAYEYMGVEPKNMGKPPNHPFVHRVGHYFHHPFWGFSHYFWVDTHIVVTWTQMGSDGTLI